MLLEAGWMGQADADASPMVLARVDVTRVDGDAEALRVRHMGSPVVHARVVPTADAPEESESDMPLPPEE